MRPGFFDDRESNTSALWISTSRQTRQVIVTGWNSSASYERVPQPGHLSAWSTIHANAFAWSVGGQVKNSEWGIPRSAQ